VASVRAGLVSLVGVDAWGTVDRHLVGLLGATDDHLAVVGLDVDIVGKPTLGVGVFGVV
jgi:hypothetical protein